MVPSIRAVMKREERKILARAKAVRLYREMGSIRAVAEAMHRSRTFVSDAIERKRTTKSHLDRKRSGRPHALTPSERKMLRRCIRTKTYGSIRKTTARMANRGIVVSRETVRKTARAGGMRSYKPIQKPKLSEADKEARLNWCLRIRNESILHSARRVFCDEKYFCFHEGSNRMWLYPWEQRPIRQVGT